MISKEKLVVIACLLQVGFLEVIFGAPNPNTTLTSSTVSSDPPNIIGVNSSQPTTTNNTNSPVQVTIYTNDNFFGIHWTIDVVGDCVKVPPLLYKHASSIDTHNFCVILYSRENCLGRKVIVAPGTKGHSFLSAINFDDELVSLRPCNNTSGINQNQTTTPNEKPAADATEQKRSKRSNSSAQQVSNSTAVAPSFLQEQKAPAALGSSPDPDSDNSKSDAVKIKFDNITLAHVIY